MSTDELAKRPEMDCLTFRRKLLEDPFRHEPDLLEHEEDCALCAEFARGTRSQEARLRALLNEVKPPPELTDRIKLAASFERPAMRQARRWLPVAASILLVVTAISVSLFVTPLERRTMSLADSVLDHMHDELHHLNEVRTVTPAQLSQLFDRFGAVITGNLGRVNFAAECLMREKTGVHLIFPGSNGPVTVFFMPHEAPAELTRFADANFKGHIVPTGWGSLAVIGIGDEALGGIADRMLRAVSWSSTAAQVSQLGPVTPPRA